VHHLIELITNPWIIATLIVLFLGEYLPFTASLWSRLSTLFQRFGRWFLQSYEPRLYEVQSQKIEEKKITLKLNNFFARVFFFAISTIIVTILEIVWELGFKGIRRSIERSKVALWAETKIKTLPPWAVLLLFSTPFVLMEMLGIFALLAFVSGAFWLGVIIYLVKVLLFIPVHFILHVGKTQLMSIAWFKRRYELIVAVLEWFKTSQTYVKVHNLVKTIKAYFSAIKEMFKNTISLQKKAFEQDDILSPECEKIRQEIVEQKALGHSVATLYEVFFNCINLHVIQSETKQEK
jgi:hypothetical protein